MSEAKRPKEYKFSTAERIAVIAQVGLVQQAEQQAEQARKIIEQVLDEAAQRVGFPEGTRALFDLKKSSFIIASEEAEPKPALDEKATPKA